MLLSDLTFRMASIRLAEARSKKTPTWLYLFSYRGGEFGAGHAEELPWIFEEKTPKGSVGTVPERQALHELMQDSWIAFARSTDPRHAHLPAWPTYDNSRRATLRFRSADSGGRRSLRHFAESLGRMFHSMAYRPTLMPPPA